MFTGIVQEIGFVTVAEREGGLLRLVIAAELVVARARIGDSIAVDGVCMTVLQTDACGFAVEAMPVTLERTTLGSLSPGDSVNLEAALAAGDPLGGHIVQGHVDGVGIVRRVERANDAVLIDVGVPAEVAEVTVVRGSIALAGVSLTISALPEAGVVRVSLIPYTLEHTTLAGLRPGMELNVEADQLAKIVAEQTRRWLEARAGIGDANTMAGRPAAEGADVIR